MIVTVESAGVVCRLSEAAAAEPPAEAAAGGRQQQVAPGDATVVLRGAVVPAAPVVGTVVSPQRTVAPAVTASPKPLLSAVPAAKAGRRVAVDAPDDPLF